MTETSRTMPHDKDEPAVQTLAWLGPNHSPRAEEA
jgi:hypothetical protein